MDNTLTFDEKKAKQLILYIASKVDVGKTKLMKLLYLIDFTAYEKTGKPITNDTYEHWAYGPVPRTIWKQCNAICEGVIDQVSEAKTTGVYTKFVPRKKPDTSVFSTNELSVIDSIINEFGAKFQDELVDMVHEELPYKLTQEGEPIPYYLAPYRTYQRLSRAQVKRIKGNKEYMKRLKDSYKAFQVERAHHAAE